MDSLKNAFSDHETWLNQLNNQKSNLFNFLSQYAIDDSDPNKLSVFKLKLFGILYCKGDPEEKSSEFFETV